MSGSPWQGRVDEDPAGFCGRWHQHVQRLPDAGEVEGVALHGFASDAGVRRNRGRPGASLGPRALRGALASVPLPRPLPLYDAGDVGEGVDVEAAHAAYRTRTLGLLGRGLFPLGLGGGHDIAWPTFLALADRHGGGQAAPRIGILNLDAHLDLRPGPVATSGTAFRQAAEHCAAREWPFRYACVGASAFANTPALFARAAELGVLVIPDDADAATVRTALTTWLRGVDHLYLTVCLDVLPASVAPGVSAPAAAGVPLQQVEAVIDLALASGLLRVADVAELNPTFDVDGRTARTAARIAARIAHGVCA